MSSTREKVQIFTIGLTIGLLIAGAFFVLKLDDYFKELSLYKKVTQTFSSQPKPAEPEAPEPEKTGKKSNTKIKIKEQEAIDSANITTTAEVTTAAPDTLKNKSDSLNALMTADNDIVVKKDEMLGTRTLEVFNLSPVAKNNSKDSLLQKVSGIKDDKPGTKQMFNVELWSSPLNYKGYKLSKYKMVLYGIGSVDGIKLYRLDDAIYLKNAGIVYKLDYTADFKQYERITDEQIINKLK
jgi:hypothetical protein